MSILKVENITKDFDGIRAVDGVSFELEKAAINSLIGPNGSGKTTIFNIISGFLRSDRGEVYFNNERITSLHPFKIARLGIGRTFQNIRLFPQMSVLENVLLATGNRKYESFGAAILKTNSSRREELKNIDKSIHFLKIIGLDKKKDEYAFNLSHGQKRLLEIARTLALEPSLILLDEPTAGLFPAMIESLKQIIRELRNSGISIFIIEHDMKVVMDISDRVIVLNNGEKIGEGTPSEIQNNNTVIDAYLGRRKTYAS